LSLTSPHSQNLPGEGFVYANGEIWIDSSPTIPAKDGKKEYVCVPYKDSFKVLKMDVSGSFVSFLPPSSSFFPPSSLLLPPSSSFFLLLPP
jgi:hypothetical protein